MSEIRDRDELILTVNRLMICAMEDIDCGRNEASPTTLDLVQRIEDTDAALRLALETATRERDEARQERASYEAKLAVKWLLEEEYEASCHDRDAMARMCDDLRRTIRTVFALITDWRDGNAHVGRPRSVVDQHFIDAIHGVQTHPATEVKLTVEGQRGGTATFTHWSGTATKPEEP